MGIYSRSGNNNQYIWLYLDKQWLLCNFQWTTQVMYPEKSPLSTVTDKELKMIPDELNSLPRKRMGFKTSNEVFMQSLNRVALCVGIYVTK